MSDTATATNAEIARRGLPSVGEGTLSLAAVALLAALPIWAGGFWLYSLALVLTHAIAILSVSFLIRYSGEVSIGHNFFVAVGAYTVAVLQNELGVPFLLGTAVAVILSVFVGLLFALPSRGLSGVYLSVATLALGLSVPEILLYFSDITGGFEGLFLDSTITGILPTEIEQYYLALIALCVAAFAVHRFRHSRVGLAILTARDHPHAAASFGMHLGTARLSVFAVSAAIAGLGGAVLGFTTSMVSPNSFTFWSSVTLLVGSVVSLYSTHVYGAVIGGAFIALTPQILSNYGQVISIIYGLALVGVILLANVVVPAIVRHIRRRQNRYV